MSDPTVRQPGESDLDVAISLYLSQIDAGERVDPEQFCQENPNLAAELREFFAGDAFAQILAGMPVEERLPGENWNVESHESIDVAVEAKAGTLGDFRILREIGRGGMGIVYEAEQISLGRRVALKILPFAAMLDARKLQRFRNEAQAAACLEHPNIVTVYSVGVDRGVHYYAMRYIDGRNLAELFRELRSINDVGRNASGTAFPAAPAELVEHLTAGPDVPSGTTNTILFAEEQFPHDSVETSSPPLVGSTMRLAAAPTDIGRLGGDHIAAIVMMGIAAAEALEFAHSHGVIHRDIKPSNLMVDARGHLWVADFGLAQIGAGEEITLTGDLFGTLRYMSPEQASGQRGYVDHRTDVYSLGATLYELLTLQPLFPESDRAKLLQCVAGAEPVSPRLHNPQIPVDLETVVLKAISKDREARYGTAGELADDLKRFRDHKPISAKRPGLFERGLKWARRHREFTAAAAIMTAVLLVLSTVSLGALYFQNARLQSALVENQKSQDALASAVTTAKHHELLASETAYAMTIRLADKAYKDHDPAGAVDLLNRLVPPNTQHDMRGVEWFDLHSRISSSLQQTRLSDHELYCVQASPDGKLLAAAGRGAVVYLVDAISFANNGQIATGQMEVNSLSFSPDGKTLASSGDDGTIRLWEIASRRELWTVSAHPERAWNARFINDGSQIVSFGSEPVVRVWNAVNGELVQALPAHREIIRALATSLRQDLFASLSDDGELRVWDARRLTVLRTMQTPTGRQAALAFSPDGRLMLTGHGDGQVMLWPVAYFGSHEIGRCFDAVHSVSFSTDGRKALATDVSGALRLWPVDELGVELVELPVQMQPLTEWRIDHTKRLDSCGFNHDGTMAAVLQNPHVHFRDLQSGETATLELADHGLIKDYDRSRSKQLCAFSSDGQYFVCVNQVYRSAPGEPLKWAWHCQLDVKAGRVFSVEFRKDSPQLLAGNVGHYILLLDAATGKAISTSETIFGSDTEGANGPSLDVNDVLALSAKEQFVACTSRDQLIYIYDVATRKKVSTCEGHKGSLVDVDFSPDELQIASAGRGIQTVQIWDVATGKLVRTIPNHSGYNRSVDAVAYSPDGRWLATAISGVDGSLRIWDLQHNRTIWYGARGADSVRFAPDGKRLFSADRETGCLAIWDVSSAFQPVSNPIVADAAGNGDAPSNRDEPAPEISQQTWLAHLGRAYEVACLGNSGNLVTVGADGMLKKWNSNSDSAAHVLVPEGGESAFGDRSFAVSQDGDMIAVVTEKELRTHRRVADGWKFSGKAGIENCRSLAIAPNGRQILTGHNDGKIRVWDAATLQQVTEWPIVANARINEIAVSSDRGPVAVCVGGKSDKIRVFDFETRQRVKAPQTDVGGRVTFSPDGSQLAFGANNDVIVWSVAENRELSRLAKHTNSVTAVAYDPTGGLLASGSSDRSIIIWDVKTGNPLWNFSGHRAEINSLTFSPDSKSLLSAGEKDGVKIWHVATSLHLTDFSDKSNQMVSFVPGSCRLVLLKSNERVIVHDFDLVPSAH